MRNRLILPILSIVLLTACATNPAHRTASSTAAVDQGAGAWRTWVLGSGKDLRVPPPPDSQATAAD